MLAGLGSETFQLLSRFHLGILHPLSRGGCRARVLAPIRVPAVLPRWPQNPLCTATCPVGDSSVACVPGNTLTLL